MDVKKLAMGTVAGGLVALGVGYLIFGVALASYMAENAAHTKEPDMLWLIAGHLVYGALMTYIFMQCAIQIWPKILSFDCIMCLVYPHMTILIMILFQYFLSQMLRYIVS